MNKLLQILILLGLTMSIAAHCAAQDVRLVRIGITEDRTEIDLKLQDSASILDYSGSDPKTIQAAGDQLIFTGSGNAILMNSIPITNGPILIVPGSSMLSWNSHMYRGEFIIYNKNGKLTLVNRLPLEDYVRGVLPCEVSPSWAMASLKAQAITARTYSVASLNRHESDNFDLCATTHCQVYGGASVEKPTTDQAVAQTAGQVLTYNNKVIYAFYHDSSGGYTEDPANIWATTVPYLKPVPDWDFNAPLFQWTRTLKWSDLQVSVGKSYPKIGRLKQILPVSFGINNRILKLTLLGDLGEVTITGEQFRYVTGIPSSNIQLGIIYGPDPFITMWWVHGSIWPEVLTSNTEIPGLTADVLNPPWNLPDPWSWLQDKVPVTVVVKGAGWGHSIGMSQWGAKGMAEAGYNERQILDHYYPGTAISLLDDMELSMR